MARSISVNQSGTYKEVVQAYVRDGGVWKSPTEIYVNQSGTWKQVYPDTGSIVYTSGSGNFTVPNGVQTITYTIVGGGGGGSWGFQAANLNFGYNYPYIGGGGGSGGFKVNQTLAVTPGQVIAYSVGAGGATTGGGGYGNLIGTDGSSTTFGADSVTGGGRGVGHNVSGGGANPYNVSYSGAAGSPNGNAGQWGTVDPKSGPALYAGGTGYGGYGNGGDGGPGNVNAGSGTAGGGGAVIISW
jgi:hypothetical protein